MSTFEAVREVTGWQRPPGNHGCPPAEIVPGLWNAHYHDIDTLEKLQNRLPSNLRLTVNTATCDCSARTGTYGLGIEVFEVELEDDPEERKQFDAGKVVTSKVADPTVPLIHRCPGDAKKHFPEVNAAIGKTISEGGAVLVHCMASLSRSIVFVAAYIMQTQGLSAVDAIKLIKSKWAATWPNDRFVTQLVEYEQDLRAPVPRPLPKSTFEEFRLVTGWQRPPGDHGCPAAEIVPGLWNAHYHDIDTLEKFQQVLPANLRLVVNSAVCQCADRTGSFGPEVQVLEIDIEDDPDPLKKFYAGQETQSNCADPSIPAVKRVAGDAKKHFAEVNRAIGTVISEGGAVLVHCHASLSRSIVFVLAYIMETQGLTAVEAAKLVRSKWDATWPNDRFVHQLIEYEQELLEKALAA